MDDSQILKGVLEGCILAVIAQGETYGYEILSFLEDSGFENLMEGTLYPMLTRLEKNGFLSCRKAKSPFGPMRKYYSITPKGKMHLEEFRSIYVKITAAAQKILDGENQKAKENENG